MSKLSVTPVAQDDAKQNAYMQEFARRIEATPPWNVPRLYAAILATGKRLPDMWKMHPLSRRHSSIGRHA